MKMRADFLPFVAIAVAALGADLKLTDGRVFEDYRITTQTPTTVTVRHAGGMARIEKKLLPPEVLEAYPVDEAAAPAEAAEIAKGRAVWEAQRRAPSEKPAEDNEGRPKSKTAPTPNEMRLPKKLADDLAAAKALQKQGSVRAVSENP
jgi:hypothetical protein